MSAHFLDSVTHKRGTLFLKWPPELLSEIMTLGLYVSSFTFSSIMCATLVGIGLTDVCHCCSSLSPLLADHSAVEL